MGMILECHALPAHASVPGDARALGWLSASVSINSAAAQSSLVPLVDGPLAGIDLAGGGPAGVRFELSELSDLLASLAAAGVGADIYNAIADAVEESQFRQSALWIGFA